MQTREIETRTWNGWLVVVLLLIAGAARSKDDLLLSTAALIFFNTTSPLLVNVSSNFRSSAISVLARGTACAVSSRISLA